MVCLGIHRQQLTIQRLGVSEITVVSMDVFLLIMITVIDLVSGFYPRFPPYWTTKTHYDITNAGTLQAVSEYIFSQKMNATSPSTAFDDFFGTGMTIVFFY